MRFSQIILSILPLASNCLALPTTTSRNALIPRQDSPSVIFPSPPTSQPADSTLVQVGFKQGLNWDFVVANPQSQSQIFSLLPQGIAYGLDIPTSSVVMESLRSFDTTADLGYTTTLARFWVPSDEVNQLRLGIQSPSSRFYTNPNASVKSLMDQINPSISVTA